MWAKGLYGHVRGNDLRSLALFAGFVAAFHVLAALALLVPLAMFDPEHAPLYGWTGYLVRWVPIITIAGALAFAVQMAWHVRMVRRKTAFRFVDRAAEPRLLRIVEPLAIAAGLSAPRVAVIDSPALNAFACGIRQKDSVLVFTRGLIDGLDDEELAAVAAHEIVHIVNGDIRLIAATNVCLDTLMLLQQRQKMNPANRIGHVLTLPLLAVALPLLVVLILAVSFLRRLAVDGSHLTRLLIASAREFIADAEAVRLTQNPAALVSALRRIEGRSAIPGLAAGQDAMMIDGAHEGALATHPTIADRIAAVIAVTGSLALIAPSRRDTRPPELRAAGGCGSRPAPLAATASSGPARRGGVLARASAADGMNRLGLTRELTVGAIAALGVFLWTHGGDLRSPGAIAAALDPAPLRAFFAMGGKGMSCQLQGIGWVMGMAEEPAGCDEAFIDDMLAAFDGESGILGMLFAQREGVRQANDGIYRYSNGTFGNVAPAEADPAAARCFGTDRYAVGDRGLYALDGSPLGNGAHASSDIVMSKYLGYKSDAVLRVIQAKAAELGPALLDYVENRETMLMVSHRFFGEAGLSAMQSAYDSPADGAILKRLRERLDAGDPALLADTAALPNIKFLLSSPKEFVPCQARRAAQ